MILGRKKKRGSIYLFRAHPHKFDKSVPCPSVVGHVRCNSDTRSCLVRPVPRPNWSINVVAGHPLGSLRSCPLPINPLCLSREEGMIHLFVGSHVKKPESGLFSDWIGNNTNDLRRFDWPKCSHPLVVIDFSLDFCLRNAAVNTHASSL